MPDETNPTVRVVSPDGIVPLPNDARAVAVSEDGISIIDLSIPAQGMFQTSLVHQLWTFFSAGATVQRLSKDEKVLWFLEHLARLGLTHHTETTPYNPLYQLHTIAGAFDALQSRALLTATGTATLPRYLAEPFFIPKVVHQRALAVSSGKPVAPRTNQWSASVLDVLSITSDTPRQEQIPSDVVRTIQISDQRLASAYPTKLHVLHSPFDNNTPFDDKICATPCFCHADSTAVILRNIMDVQQYLAYGSDPLPPYCSMLGSQTLVERKPGGFCSISCSGLYPVKMGYEVSSAPNKHPLLSPFYTVIRIPTDKSIAHLHKLSHASSSVLISGMLSFHRLTDEVFYDGVTDLITCTPVDGTKFVFITDTLTDASEINTTIVPENASYAFPNSTGLTTTNAMLAYEYKDGSLRPTKSLLSMADINFLKCLASTCKQRSAIDSAIEQIASGI